MTRRHLLPTAAAVVAVLTAAAPAVPVHAAPPDPAHRTGAARGAEAWEADLSGVDGDDVGVTWNGRAVVLAPAAPSPASARAPVRTGFLLLAPHDLAAPADAVAATVRGRVPAGAEVAVDVRGALGDGRWTGWAQARPGAPATLPTAVDRVQVRLALTGDRAGAVGPEVDGLALTASATGVTATQAGELTYRVYATREGLVGGTTANGHVIVERDHFVALPSRRGLSAKAEGAYSVRVCASTGRCEWAPVWDIGPWNTKDDYWSPADTRETWADLPQGTPQAQAAHQSGYNDGKDEFGREVANPAGVDLADGTFWDGLQLTGNDWVTVTYLWTGAGPAGFVRTEGEPLNVRSGPDSTTAQVGLAANYAQVRVECQLVGQTVTGTQGTSDVWYRIAADKHVAKAYVTGVAEAPAC